MVAVAHAVVDSGSGDSDSDFAIFWYQCLQKNTPCLFTVAIESTYFCNC